MKIKTTKYRTLSGIKEVIELPKKVYNKWIVYQDNKPKYYVDFYDLEKESNAMMNSLVLCTDRSMQEVLRIVSKKNNVNLSLPVISRLGFKMKLESEFEEIHLETMPKEWLAYSL